MRSKSFFEFELRERYCAWGVTDSGKSHTANEFIRNRNYEEGCSLVCVVHPGHCSFVCTAGRITFALRLGMDLTEWNVLLWLEHDRLLGHDSAECGPEPIRISTQKVDLRF